LPHNTRFGFQKFTKEVRLDGKYDFKIVLKKLLLIKPVIYMGAYQLDNKGKIMNSGFQKFANFVVINYLISLICGI
jgi:hypothetical protein